MPRGSLTIGVNASRLAGQRLGVARYIEYLAKHWDRMLDPSESVVLFVEKPTKLDMVGQSASVRAATVPSRLGGVLWENLALPRAARSCDVLFGPSYTLPLRYGGNTVVAIHSVNAMHDDARPAWYRSPYVRLQRQSARRATRVIVPSTSTLRDVQAAYRIPETKIEVIPQGADESFRPLDDQAVASETRQRLLGRDRPFIVFVGKLSARRNIPVLIRAFAEAKRRGNLPHALVLFGPNHLGLPLADLAAELGVGDSVVQTDGRVQAHTELVRLYNAADLYVSASSYEGFSLTMVEAMACGTPVVAVDAEAQREIVGDAGLLVEDSTADAVAEGIVRVLTDAGVRQRLAGLGPARASRFSWADIAGRTLDVLRAVAAA